MEQSLKKQQELLEEAAGKKEYTQQLGQFLTKMDQAGPLLVTMLSSRSIVDTVEVIRVFSFLHGYGFDFCPAGIRKMLTLVFSKDQQVQNAVIDCY